MTEITDHLAEIVERIARASKRANRDPSTVTLVAVTKQQPPDTIAETHRLGLRHFGESYVQEAVPKITTLAGSEIVWHFVGRLQTNKTRPVAEHFAWVHTVDRLRVAQRLSEQRPAWAGPLNVLLQVNMGLETHKGGVPVAETHALALQIAQLPRLRLRGLMTLPPRDERQSVAAFQALARLKSELVGSGLSLDTLSMGMSDDFELAIEAGATMVRIGTALFGARTTR